MRRGGPPEISIKPLSRYVRQSMEKQVKKLFDLLVLPVVVAFLVSNVCGASPWTSPPIASAGGPYVVLFPSGHDLVFDGSDSMDPDMSFGDTIVNYLWNVEALTLGESSSRRLIISPYDLASMIAGYYGFLVIANPLTGQPRYSVALTVRDTTGLTHTALTSLTFYGDYDPPPSVSTSPTGLLLGLGLLVGRAFRRRHGQRGQIRGNRGSRAPSGEEATGSEVSH